MNNQVMTDEEIVQAINPNLTLEDLQEKLKTLKFDGKQITWEEIKETFIKKIEKKEKYKEINKIKKIKIAEADEKRHTANAKRRKRKKLKKQRMKMRGHE